MPAIHKTIELEEMIIGALKPIIRELRMIEVSDFICYLHLNQHNHIGDIFDSACEQYFAPDFFAYRETGRASIDWGKAPTIHLDIMMNTPCYSFEFRLVLESDRASVQLSRINENDHQDQEIDPGEILRQSIITNAIIANSTAGRKKQSVPPYFH